MALELSNMWWIDGIDLWSAFNLVIHKGATTFLELPPKKEGIEHDWLDADGKEFDLSKIFFQSREITLDCSIIATDEAAFIQKRDLLLNQFRKPGHRRLQFRSTGQRSFYVFYKDSSGWTAREALKGTPAEGQVMYSFNLVFVETNPMAGASEDVFLVTHDGAFLIA